MRNKFKKDKTTENDKKKISNKKTEGGKGRETKTHDLISAQWNCRGIFDLVAIEFFIDTMCRSECTLFWRSGVRYVKKKYTKIRSSKKNLEIDWFFFSNCMRTIVVYVIKRVRVRLHFHILKYVNNKKHMVCVCLCHLKSLHGTYERGSNSCFFLL